MPLNRLTHHTSFAVGMFTGILLFAGLNFYDISAHYQGIDLWGCPGIPFPFVCGAGNIFGIIEWPGLFADITFALAMSFCIGVTSKSVWEEISKSGTTK